MHLIVHGHGRCQSTGSETGNSLYCKKHIVCGVFLFAKSQFFLQGFQNRKGFADVTGGSVTDLDDVFSLGFKRKILIEGCYTVAFASRTPISFAT